jgi:hypothetical protein
MRVTAYETTLGDNYNMGRIWLMATTSLLIATSAHAIEIVDWTFKKVEFNAPYSGSLRWRATLASDKPAKCTITIQYLDEDGFERAKTWKPDQYVDGETDFAGTTYVNEPNYSAIATAKINVKCR